MSGFTACVQDILMVVKPCEVPSDVGRAIMLLRCLQHIPLLPWCSFYRDLPENREFHSYLFLSLRCSFWAILFYACRHGRCGLLAPRQGNLSNWGMLSNGAIFQGCGGWRCGAVASWPQSSDQILFSLEALCCALVIFEVLVTTSIVAQDDLEH